VPVFAVIGRLSWQVWLPAVTVQTPSGPALKLPAGWPIVVIELLAATLVVAPKPGCGAAGAPPRTGVPDRPGAGVPVAPIEGNVPCWTVEDWTGCNCWGALTTLSPAVLERVVGEQAASSSAAAATPKTEPAPRIQSFMSDSCPRA
jgi:hypothetical protein